MHEKRWIWMGIALLAVIVFGAAAYWSRQEEPAPRGTLVRSVREVRVYE